MAIEPAPREQHAPRRSIIRHVMFWIAVAWFCCFYILLVALLHAAPRDNPSATSRPPGSPDRHLQGPEPQYRERLRVSLSPRQFA